MDNKTFICDTHCHLDYLDDHLDRIRLEARQHHVGHFMTIGVEEKHWENLLTLATDDDIDCALGIHPCDVTDAKEGWAERLLAIAKDPRVKAIGETGLDNYHDKTQHAVQYEALLQHAFIAKKLDKPLVIHMREAKEPMKLFLDELKHPGILHCFSEDYETAKYAIDRGMYISFSGIVTFKNAVTLHDCVKRLPLDKILLETDSPFLAPTPFRGQKNKPAYTKYVCDRVAEIKGLSWEVVAEQTTKNFFQLTR